MPKRTKTFACNERGVAAVEFALVIGPLILLSLGAFELQRYLRFERQLSAAAETIAVMAAQRQQGDTNDPAEDMQALNLLVTVRPLPTMNFQMTNIVFTPTTVGCTSNCDYRAHVAWNWPNWTTMGQLRRVCGELTKASGSSAPSGSTLPAELFGPGNLIAVEIAAAYRPVLGSTFIAPVTITRQGFANARFVTPYLRVHDHVHTRKCAGYP